MNNQIKTLFQFQSSISQFQSTIDCEIGKLSSNIDYIVNFKTFVTKCVKSYLCNYVKCITAHYCSCYNSLKQNIETFKSIQECVKTMLSDLNPRSASGRGTGRRTNGSKGKVIGLFTYVSSDDDTRATINNINRNYPSQKLGLINVYYTMVHKFLDPSNPINLTLNELTNVKNYTSQFSGYIGHYNTIKWFFIPRLDRLTRTEFTSTLQLLDSIGNGPGNGIKDKYDKIKQKVEYCKTSLEFEVERLESISNNARMLQKHLELLIGMLKKYKTIEERLKQLKYKLNRMKKNKKKSMDHITRTVRMIMYNLYDVNCISNTLNSAKDKISITTIKKDVDNINSSIKDINNILSIVKSHLESLLGLKLGIDCMLVNDFECCMKEIVCDIHKKYCCVSSELSSVFSEPSQVQTLLENCKLPEIMQCRCTPQSSSEACATCQDCKGDQSCQICEYLKQLSKSCSDSNNEEKLKSINKVICMLIDGKKVDGCEETQHQQCSNVCQTVQQGQPSNTCETTQGGQTTNICLTTVGQLIKSTLEEIKQCEQSSKVTDACKDEVKCENPPNNSCQTSAGETQSPTSCPTTTTQGVVSCKELDKVKLCLDTMINKCNCPQLKELLKGQNIKSCVNVLKWVIICNFRELFSLYLCFDRSILNEISCCLNKLEGIKSIRVDLYFVGIGINFMLDCIKDEINKIPEHFKSLENTMKSGIRELECAIEGVARNFILCTINRVSSNLINSTQYSLDKQVVGIYSVLNVMDYKVVVNRLFDSAKKIDQILQLNNNIYMCKCIYELEWSNTSIIDLRSINVKKIIEHIASKNKLDDLKLDKINRLVQDDIKDNHFCLCMVFKYVLYPKIIDLTYLMSKDIQTLSTISRQYTKYTLSKGFMVDLSQFLLVCLELLYKLSLYILMKYKYTWVSGHPFHVRCFCMYSHDPGYYSVIIIIWVISSLIENIWTMDSETLRMSIEKLSILYAQLEIYDLNSTSLKPVCCNSVYSLLVTKEFKTKSDGKCCCWCVTCYNLAIILIYLSFQCKLCNAICNNSKNPNGCKKVKDFCEVVDCECQCTVPNQGVCCLLNLALSTQVSGSGANASNCKTLEKILEECKACTGGGNGCCAQLLKKVKNGLCKVLLLGCGCTCTPAGDNGELKVKCVFFNNPYAKKSVAVVVFCKCAKAAKCCLTTVIDNLKQKLTSWSSKICQDAQCVCDELKVEELCCSNGCAPTCPAECVCKKLDLKKICNGDTGKCLCKEMQECLKNLCTKKEKCQCNEKGCCRCVCCKVLGVSIKILARACRANVLEPYQRIILDLLGSDKDKPQLVRSILDRINQTRLNNIYLVKNNFTSVSYPDSKTGLTDISSVRNWGYDTQYEVQPTDNSLGDV